MRVVWMLRQALNLIVTVAVLSLLSGCLLMSGETTSIDLQGDSGNLNTSFVSAEGVSERTVRVAEGVASVQVITMVAIESGDLTFELLDPEGAVVFSVASRPDGQVTRSSMVLTDINGEVRYRVKASGARNGNFQIFFQR